MSRTASIGVDIGGTKTLCLLVDEQLDVEARIKFKTNATAGQKRFTSELVKALKELKNISRRKKLKVCGVGFGFAGLVDKVKCQVKVAPNIQCLEGAPLGKVVEQAIGLKSVMANDVHMGLYAEHQAGAAKGCAHALGVFFGTGVGGAAIMNGRLYEGASGLGGQVGCILAQPVGGPEAAQSHGMVDRIASKGSIASEALQMAVKNTAPYLHKKVGADLSKIGWGILSKAIKNGDKLVEQMLKARMQVVGIALSSVVNFMNPEVVVLGGGLVDELPKLVVAEFGQGLRQHLVPEVAEALEIKRAKLGGDAVAIGGARLALLELG